MDITALAQLWVAPFLGDGDLAIDATVGNGHDTLFLARGVGPTGRVFGFDVQETALGVARQKMGREQGLLDRVILEHRSHTEMETALSETGEDRRAAAIMFNLGYLPGADKSITTQAGETMKGLATALGLLAPRGILTIVLYPGHPEGRRESQVILEWARNLTGPVEVIFSRPWNRAETAPCLLAVEKKK